MFLWNLVDLERIKWEGPDVLTPGRHTVEFDFKYDGLGSGTLAFNSFSGVGRSGTGTLKVDGKVVATKEMEQTLPMILQWDESFDIGSDTCTGVNDADYKPPFTFTGKLNKLTIKVDGQIVARRHQETPGGDEGRQRRTVGDDLGLLHKIEMRIDKRADCRKQADAKKLGLVERIDFVRECMK